MEYLTPYLPADQYKVRAWLRPDGLLIMLKTEEMARRVKEDLEMRDPEFDVDYWAVRPKEEKKESEEPKEPREPAKPMAKMAEKETLESSNQYSALGEDL